MIDCLRREETGWLGDLDRKLELEVDLNGKIG